MANNPIAIDASDLQYYDKQIKKYIDDKDAELKASLANLVDIDKRIDAVSEKASVNEANIISHREELDDIEAAILVLQNDDKSIHNEVAELKAEIQNKLDESAMEYLATKEFVKAEIANAELSGKEVDLTNYYTKSEVDAKIPDISNLATKEEVEEVQNVAGSNSVKIFAIESDLFDIEKKLETIPSIEGLASEQFVLDKISEIDIPEVPTKVSELENDAGYITEIPSEYITETELDSMNFISEDKVSDEYVSKEIYQESIVDINKKIDSIEIPDTSNFATKDDLNNLATIEYITNNYISNTEAENFATHSELEEAVTEVVDQHFEEIVIVHVDEEIEKKLAENQTINYGTFGEV